MLWYTMMNIVRYTLKYGSVFFIIVGEITTLALNSPKRASLRTTIPMFIVKQWGLHAGDKLDWSLEARENEIVILVKKAEPKTGKKKG
jgi:hypothetical protein